MNTVILAGWKIRALPTQNQFRDKHVFCCPDLRRWAVWHIPYRWKTTPPSRSGGTMLTTTITTTIARGCTNDVVDFDANFLESCDIQNANELELRQYGKKEEITMESTFAMTSTWLAWCTSDKESFNMVVWNVNCFALEIWSRLWIEGTLTFTSPCHSDTLPLPSLNRFIIRGMFLMPFRWLCSSAAVAMFSDRRKQPTASCRALIVDMESEGRRSQVRRRARPKVVLVPFNTPKTAIR